MRVLLTGATGFIGSHVARCMIAGGAEVYALFRPESDPWRIADIVDSLRIVPCDLLADEELQRRIDRIRPDLCVHLAWCAEPRKYLRSSENVRVLSASLQLATHLAKLGCGRFVGVGTCLEYDTSVGYLSESSPTRPQSLYAASKLALHLVLQQLSAVTGMQVAWVRLFYLYGPFEDERRLVPSVIASLLRRQAARVTKGEQVRDFLHVQDVAAAIWSVAQSDLSGPVNVGSGTPVTVRGIVDRIGVLLGRREAIEYGALSYSPYEPMFVCAENRQLVEKAAWKPHWSLEDGLHDTVEWWKARLASTQTLRQQ